MEATSSAEAPVGTSTPPTKEGDAGAVIGVTNGAVDGAATVSEDATTSATSATAPVESDD